MRFHGKGISTGSGLMGSAAGALLAVLLLALFSPAFAGEVFLSAGTAHDSDSHSSGTSWSASWRQNWGKYGAFGFTYLNEGHRESRDRDGLAAQAWGRADFFDRKFSLAVGAGPYLYADTQGDAVTGRYRNEHGFGLLSSATATWYGLSPLLFQARVDGLLTDGGSSVLLGMFGVGFLLGTDGPAEAPSHRDTGGATRRNEISVFAGQSVLNVNNSEKDITAGLEYRRRLMSHLDWTVSFIHEGDSRPFGRYGIATQFWGMEHFFDERLSIGLGAGPYVAHDRFADDSDRSTKLNGDVSVTVAWWIHPRVAVRATVSRIVTNDDRDTDLFAGGLSYRF